MIDSGRDRSDRAAAVLWERWQSRRSGGFLPGYVRPVTLSDAWAVQVAFAELAGPTIGWKVAASSIAGQQHIGASGPIAGPLLASGLRQSGETVPLTRMASAEPEIAFRLGKSLPASGGPYGSDEIMASVSEVLPSIEIPDSRFSEVSGVGQAQILADMACTAYVVLGAPIRTWEFGDLKDRRVLMRVNGEVVADGVGSNALGGPLNALLWLVDEVTERGSDLLAGQIVITGAAAPPAPIRVGDIISCEVDGAPPVTTTIACASGHSCASAGKTVAE